MFTDYSHAMEHSSPSAATSWLSLADDVRVPSSSLSLLPSRVSRLRHHPSSTSSASCVSSSSFSLSSFSSSFQYHSRPETQNFLFIPFALVKDANILGEPNESATFAGSLTIANTVKCMGDREKNDEYVLAMFRSLRCPAETPRKSRHM